jgi:hypothetical protein
MPAEDLAAFQFTPDEDEAVRADRARFIRRILDPLAPDGAPPKA